MMSSRIWFLNWRKVGLASMIASSLPLRSMSLLRSRRAAASVAACSSLLLCEGAASRLIARVLGVSPRRTWPTLRDRSSPPPLMMLELSPVPSPPCMASLSGFWK